MATKKPGRKAVGTAGAKSGKPAAAPKTAKPRAPKAGKPTPPQAAKPERPSSPRKRKAPEVRNPPAVAIEVRAGDLDAEPDPAATAKLAVGRGAEAGERPAQIPWSYGIDRVTAAAVDPERLFVYWEVGDPAIERARAALGPGGPGAWLNLRVYDTSGRIFDGTNAHSYFDHAVDRADRQWFFHVGKPSSTAFVELGMKSPEGYFAKIVRSGRVDFPRREPTDWSDPEWMTVRPWSGEVEERHRSPALPPGDLAAAGGGGQLGSVPPALTMREPIAIHEVLLRQMLESGWERVEWSEGQAGEWWELEGRVEWESPRLVSSWEAGPFEYPVAISPIQRTERQGQGSVYRAGEVTHVVEGPWQVVIRHLGARAEHEVIGRWEIHRSWSRLLGRAVPAGGDRGRALGGSERAWLSGSEARMGGASERWRVGASEVAWRGASERLFAGASQWRVGGASERMMAGASQWSFAGASERVFGGASEQAFAGGSERVFAGGSEARIGGSAQPLPYPPVQSATPGKEG